MKYDLHIFFIKRIPVIKNTGSVSLHVIPIISCGDIDKFYLSTVKSDHLLLSLGSTKNKILERNLKSFMKRSFI